jgi:hypothetical protein
MFTLFMVIYVYYYDLQNALLEVAVLLKSRQF